MKMYKILFLSVVFLVNCCQAQDTNMNIVNNPGSTPSVMPFKFENEKDCLDIGGHSGSLFLGLFVSEDGKINNFNILHIKVIEGSDTLLTYTEMVYKPMNLEDYPEQVKPYHFYVKDYVSSLILKPKSGVKIQKTNIIYLNVKIGCK
jgi:hypothetical protein